MGDSFDEARRKKNVELKIVEVLVPHFNHGDSNVIAYASVIFIRYNHNKIVQCYIKILKNQGKAILTIWEVMLGFVMLSKLKGMLVVFLVDVSFTTLPLKSRVRKISCVYVAFIFTTKGYFVMEPNVC
jgi:predicted metallopeptidase